MNHDIDYAALEALTTADPYDYDDYSRIQLIKELQDALTLLLAEM